MVCGGVPQRPTGLLWQNTSPSIHHRLEIARLPGKELSAGVAGCLSDTRLAPTQTCVADQHEACMRCGRLVALWSGVRGSRQAD